VISQKGAVLYIRKMGKTEPFREVVQGNVISHDAF
jgi:hypothetical protein